MQLREQNIVEMHFYITDAKHTLTILAHIYVFFDNQNFSNAKFYNDAF